MREAPIERLQLRRLGSTDIRVLVASQYVLDEEYVDRLTRYVADLSNGNPFFIHELLTALEDERVLRIDTDRSTLEDLGNVRTPPLLKQVIERRLARLNTTVRKALEVASVIGQDVPLDIWRAIIQLPDDQLDVLVQEALEYHILDEAPDSAGWRFSHALVREALHEGIALIRRRRLHRQVAEILAQRPLADPDAVAHHFQQASDPRAADWLIRAGERAQRSHAWFIAADRFEAAVGLLEAVPERDCERAWLLYRISQLRRHLDGHQGIVYLDEALEIASACGDEELVVAVLQGRGLLKCYVGDLQTGLSDLEAGVIAAERLGIEAGASVRPGSALNRGVYALWLSAAGRFHDALAVARQHLSTATIPATLGATYRALAVAYGFLGEPDLGETGIRSLS